MLSGGVSFPSLDVPPASVPSYLEAQGTVLEFWDARDAFTLPLRRASDRLRWFSRGQVGEEPLLGPQFPSASPVPNSTHATPFTPTSGHGEVTVGTWDSPSPRDLDPLLIPQPPGGWLVSKSCTCFMDQLWM